MDAYVGLGSNLGDREHFLGMAHRELDATPGLRVAAASDVYETEPVGPSRRRFLNAVLRLESRLAAPDLFARMMAIERGAGRDRSGPRWGPRTLDLDLLLYGDERIERPELRVPHPRWHERDFVLVPLVDVGPDVRHPVLGRSAREWLDDRAPVRGVWRHGPFPGSAGPVSPSAGPCRARS